MVNRGVSYSRGVGHGMNWSREGLLQTVWVEPLPPRHAQDGPDQQGGRPLKAVPRFESGWGYTG